MLHVFQVKNKSTRRIVTSTFHETVFFLYPLKASENLWLTSCFMVFPKGKERELWYEMD